MASDARQKALDRGFEAVHAWFRAFGSFAEARSLVNPELRTKGVQASQDDARAAVRDFAQSAKDFNRVEVIRGD